MLFSIRSLAFLLALALTGCGGPMMQLLGNQPDRGPADIMVIEMNDPNLNLKGLILTWDTQMDKYQGIGGESRESNSGLFVFPVPAWKPVRLYGIWWSEDRKTSNFCGDFKVWRNGARVHYKKYVYANPSVPCIYDID
jgi:hypothetical protein